MPAFYQFSFRNFQNPLGRLVFPACLVITLMLAGGAGAQAAIYYVSTAGNDSNTGTLALPFRTIQKAANLMRAGDTCLIRAGTYRETITPANSGASGAPITFDAYNGERVSFREPISSRALLHIKRAFTKQPCPQAWAKGRIRFSWTARCSPKPGYPIRPRQA